MTSSQLRWRRLLTPSLSALLVAVACGETEPPAGLMLAIASDGPLPIDRLDLRIESHGRVLRDTSYRVPEEAQLPTTLAIATNDDATASVNIVVIGWNGDQPLDRRDTIVTQVPNDRVAILPVVLSGRCSSKVRLEGGQAVSECEPGSTCDPATGNCTSAAVEGRALASYRAGDEDQLSVGGSASTPSGGGAPDGGGAPTMMSGGGGMGGALDPSSGGAGGAEEPAAGGAGGAPVGCSETCSDQNGTPRCEAGECQIDCFTGFKDCNDDRSDGCEAELAKDVDNCGMCEKACVAELGGTPFCADSACGEALCADTTEDENNCGACGVVCESGASAHVTSNLCSGSQCNPVCAGSFLSCDTDRENGCETDSSNDEQNCGACDEACATTNATSTSCSGGVCQPTCQAGWGKCETPEQGCVTPLGTVTNCTACGNACGVATPFCEPGGCADHRDIVVVNSGTRQVAGWNGSGGGASEIKLNHGLATAKGSNRMVLVGVAATDAFLDPEHIVVTYNGVTMTSAKKQLDPLKQSFAGVYYLLDAQLPTSTGSYLASASFETFNQWGHGGVHVVELKNVMQVAPLVPTGATGGDCAGNAARSLVIANTQPGAFVYGLLTGKAAASIATTTAAGVVESWNQQQPTPGGMAAASAYAISSGSRTLGWNVPSCFNTAAAGVAIKRLSAN